MMVNLFVASIAILLAHIGQGAEIVSNGNLNCNDQDRCDNTTYICPAQNCNFQCTGTPSCIDSTFICNSTETGTCAATCSSFGTCENFRLISYAQTTTIMCQGSKSCKNGYIRAYGDDDGDDSNNDGISGALTCTNSDSCNGTYFRCDDDVATCSASCQETGSCSDATFRCTATDDCSFAWRDDLFEVCDPQCTIQCFEDVCDCTTSAGDRCNDTQIVYDFLNEDTTGSMDSTATMDIETTAYLGNGTRGGGGLNTNNKDTSINSLLYNIIIGMIYLLLFGYCAFEFVVLWRSYYFEETTLFGVIPLLVVITAWQFLVCIILGSLETYMSDSDLLAGTYICALSIPFNLLMFLVVMIIFSIHSKHADSICGVKENYGIWQLMLLRGVTFFALKANSKMFIVNKLGGHYGLGLIIVGIIIYLPWMVISIVFAGDDEANIVFNASSFVVFLFCFVLLSIVIEQNTTTVVQG